MRVYTNFGKFAMLATALLMRALRLALLKPHADYKFKGPQQHQAGHQEDPGLGRWKRMGLSSNIGDGIEAGATDEFGLGQVDR